MAKSGKENNNFESIFVRVDPQQIIEIVPFIVESVKYPSGEIYVMNYSADPEGRPAEEIIYNLMGQVVSKIEIVRDESGNVREYRFSDGRADRNKYDKQENRIERIDYEHGIPVSIAERRIECYSDQEN